MTYTLYLDDERTPKMDRAWVIVRSVEAFKQTLQERGAPVAMSLDHDLGFMVPTGYDALKWYLEEVLDGRLTLCPEINIHSANPVGARNMRGLIESFLKHHHEVE